MKALQPRIITKTRKQRLGRGFSREELKKAGTHPREALKLGLMIDMKRKTAHAENIEAAKKFLETNKPKVKTKTKSKN